MVRYYSSYYRKLLGINTPRTKPRISKKRVKVKPVLTVTKKKVVKKAIPKKAKLQKAKLGYSRHRRGQLAMKPQDIYEKQMVKRIMKKSGMTYIQSMQLAKKARDTDFDVEHKVDWSLSKDKSEQYEQSLKMMEKEMNPLKKKSIRELGFAEALGGF